MEVLLEHLIFTFNVFLGQIMKPKDLKVFFFLFKQLWRVYPQWTKWEKKTIKVSPVKRNHYIFKNFDLYIRK